MTDLTLTSLGANTDADSLYAEAQAAMEAGDMARATLLLTRAAELAPTRDDLHGDLGFALETQGDYDGARAAYAEAIRLAPDVAVHHYNLGAACQALGMAHEAAVHYVDAIEREPLLAEAYFNLGTLFFEAGHLDVAIQHYKNALVARPTYAEAAGNLALTYRRMGVMEGAVEWYRAALALRPELAVSHLNLGIVLGETGRHEEAVAELRHALQIEPRNLSALVHLSFSLRGLGQPERAAEEALAALAIDPDHAGAHVELGQTAAALQAAGKGQQVQGLVARWRMAAGDHPILRHTAAALGLEKAPDRADGAYVEQLFDASARRFDETVQGLDYRVPALIREALATYAGTPAADREVLDAGCGTGLAGEALRPYARQLRGVDLSMGMIEIAAARRIYDELEQAELVGWLAARPAAFDIAVMGDVLCYFGDLGGPVGALAGALNTHGLGILTVEAAEPWAAPFTLRESGRYTHRRDYVEQALKTAGLAMLELRSTTLRQEGGQPVEGILAVVRKA
ncbi:MAG TPA: tetratricopeptide repeat protein [Azospirillaceae bacterium]|nr:tetratricopeptide repeat protein [Azospirillaceae bacterium]